MKKRVFQWLIALAVVLPCLLLTAFAAERTVTASGTCGTNLTWTLYSDGELVISGTGALSSDGWDYYSDNIKKVTIGDKVTSIGDSMFFSADSLTTVNMGNGVTSIGDEAFSYCYNLSSVTMGAGLESIGSGAFFDCDSLHTVTIPNGVTEIRADAFYSSGLTSVNIPASVEFIGDSAFSGCTSLTAITVNAANPNYRSENGVLYDKEKCELIQYPAGKAGTYTLPDSVTYVRDDAFNECYALTAIYANATNSVYKSAGGVLFNKEKTKLVRYPGGKSGAYTIPDGVTHIADGAFSFCDGVTAVTIPDSVTEIGWDAFAYCFNLASVDIGKGVKELGGAIFAGCSSLTAVTIPNSVTSIGYSAFAYCEGLTAVTIPNSVTSIGDYAFEQCANLSSVTLGNGVASIGERVFMCCTSLKIFKNSSQNTTYGSGVFDADWSGKKIGVTIYGLAGSTTQTYAQQNGLTFMSMEATVVPGVPAKPHNIVNTVSGVHVYWKAVAGAEKYGLWRSETGKNGTYKWIANPAVPHFTDTKVESGKTYFYKVTSMYAGKHTDKSEALGTAFLTTPDITARYNKAAGIKLEWNRITGATGYRIYRKSYSGTDAWVKVGEVTGEKTLTWTDESVKNNNGTTYRYTVRAVKNGTLSGCRNTGRTMTRLLSRTLNSAVKSGTNGVKCTWTTSGTVTGYEVRFVVNGQVIKTFYVTNYKTGTKTFTGLAAGQKYQVQVRAYKKVDGVGSFYSAWSTAKYVQL